VVRITTIRGVDVVLERLFPAELLSEILRALLDDADGLAILRDTLPSGGAWR
jgi:hypothetical protein